MCELDGVDGIDKCAELRAITDASTDRMEAVIKAFYAGQSREG
jgi:hypothetical protein